MAPEGSEITSLGNLSTGRVELGVDISIFATRNQATADITSSIASANHTALNLMDTNNIVTSLSRNTGGGLQWGLQDVSGELNKISELQNSIGLSLGVDNGSTGYDRCRMAIYEDNLTTHHHWYGSALYSDGSVAGLGFWVARDMRS